jgi:hypothetical protein
MSDPDRPPPPWLFFPIMAALGGLACAGLGIWLMTGWSDLAWYSRAFAVILTLLGFGFAVVVIGLLIIMHKLQRAARELKRDAKGVIWSIRYILNQGRINDPHPTSVAGDPSENTPPSPER